MADTLSPASMLGQIVATSSDVQGLEGLVSRGRIGRIEVEGETIEDHLERVNAWQDRSPFPVHIAAPSRTLGLPFSDSPGYSSPLALEATGRPDLAYMTGEALATASRPLSVQTPGTSIVVGGPLQTFDVDQHPAAESLVRGVRAGQVLPSARLEGAGDLDALATLSNAGLMELRLTIEDAQDVDLIRSIKEQGVFTGLIVAETNDRASYALEAVAEGADVVQSRAPGVVFDSLARGIDDGRLTLARARDASTRVLSAKVWAGLDLAPPPPATGQEGSVTSLQIRPWRPIDTSLRRRTGLLENEVARRSITVLQEDDGPLPVVGASAPPSVFTVVLDPAADPDRALPFVNTLATGLTSSRVSYTRLGLGLDQSEYETALEVARGSDLIVIAAFPETDGLLASRHFAVADQLLRLGENDRVGLDGTGLALHRLATVRDARSGVPIHAWCPAGSGLRDHGSTRGRRHAPDRHCRCLRSR